MFSNASSDEGLFPADSNLILVVLFGNNSTFISLSNTSRDYSRASMHYEFTHTFTYGTDRCSLSTCANRPRYSDVKNQITGPSIRMADTSFTTYIGMNTNSVLGQGLIEILACNSRHKFSARRLSDVFGQMFVTAYI
jgi:hypothetical protein